MSGNVRGVDAELGSLVARRVDDAHPEACGEETERRQQRSQPAERRKRWLMRY